MKAPGLVEVKSTAICKRCGDQQVAWYKTKAGKWMLCSASMVGRNQYVAHIFTPHVCMPAVQPVASVKTLAEKLAEAEAISPLTAEQRIAIAEYLAKVTPTK